jgi:hypothetical protein
MFVYIYVYIYMSMDPNLFMIPDEETANQDL